MADTEIGYFEDIKTLIVKRFDRRWADNHSWLIRLPQEDMCQALKIPSALKYESDGGPGIESLMSVLLGSSEAISDRRLFMKVQVLFWMLGAIDGHAKNFSIFLMPGGSFKMTPLYDVISAFPLIAKKQIEPQKMRMAMSVKGKNRHYLWEKIFYRHWISTAKICGFPEREMISVINELAEGLNNVFDKVGGELPSSFPADVAESVFTGMKKAKDRLVRSC